MKKGLRKVVSSVVIRQSISAIASKINRDYKSKTPVFISVLNGSFMFTADLLRKIKHPCEVSFVKISSYKGTQSSGKVSMLLGLSRNITGRNVIILEDIVDSGTTLSLIYTQLKNENPKSIKVCTLFLKPKTYKKKIKIDYKGMSMPNDFLVGYGLDLNGQYRNLKDVYRIIQ